MVTKEIILDILNDKDNFVNIVKEFPGLYSSCVTIKQNVSKENVDIAMNKILAFIDKNEKFKNLIQSLIPKIKEKETEKNSVSGLVLEINKDDESYYTSTENFVNGYRQQKQEEIQELTDDGWSADEINDFKQGAATDIYRFQQVAKGFLKGLKPGFDMYLQMDTLLKDSLMSLTVCSFLLSIS